MRSWAWPHVTRDLILFVIGVGGILHEGFIRSGETRPEWIVAFLTLCGVPTFLHQDESAKETHGDDGSQTAEV